jgi:hypothetical protein
MHELGEPERFSPVGTAARAFHFPLDDRTWEDVPKPSTRCLSVLAAIGVDASKSDWLARGEASQDPDPMFAAIAAHEASLRALSVGLNVMYTLEEELPTQLRKSNIDAWEEVIVETDDPRWIESEKNVHALFQADQEAAIGLINVEPVTLAGLAALMRHVTEYERKGDSWPGGLQDTGAKPTSIGKGWEVYLHRNIASLLERHA